MQLDHAKCWQELHFEFSAKILTRMRRAFLCDDDSYKAKANLEKGSYGLQRPSHTEAPSV